MPIFISNFFPENVIEAWRSRLVVVCISLSDAARLNDCNECALKHYFQNKYTYRPILLKNASCDTVPVCV